MGAQVQETGTGQSACIDRALCSPLSQSANRTATHAQHQYREARNSWSRCVPKRQHTRGGTVGRGGHAVKEDAVSPRRAMENRDAAARSLICAGALIGSE
ncbi:hypothetical protein NQZ68_004352 [Dissostichus eleginoides]|nr:hypothetical protein NQZ68_004352 [Dissostichus eleginoides]